MAHGLGSPPAWEAPRPPRRRWYRRKRYVVPLGLVVVAIALGAADGRRGAEPASPSARTCAVPYPDQQPTDVCADSTGAVTLADMQVVARGLRRSQHVLGLEVCVDVALRNLATGSKDFSAWDFRLQTPRGEVKSYEWTAQSTLRQGVLVAGGTTSGRVCFSDAVDQRGRFVLIYKPSGWSKARGTWLLTV
jgi:hypothetical protein